MKHQSIQSILMPLMRHRVKEASQASNHSMVDALMLTPDAKLDASKEAPKLSCVRLAARILQYLASQSDVPSTFEIAHALKEPWGVVFAELVCLRGVSALTTFNGWQSGFWMINPRSARHLGLLVLRPRLHPAEAGKGV